MNPHEKVVVDGHRLGRLPNPPDKVARRLKLADFFKALPPAPATYDVSEGITSFGMMLNDQLGDCTCAACGHAIQVWTKELTGTEVTVPDADVLALYETQGYNPSDPSTDQGAAEQSVLDTWRTKTGLLEGHALYAYASVDVTNLDEVKAGLFLFSGLYIGVELPLTAQSQAVWDVVSADPSQNGPGTWGGHAVFVVSYDADGLTLITWGGLKKMTWAFWKQYVDEAYVLLPTDFSNLPNQPLANGFDAAQLEQQLLSFSPVNG